MSKWNANREGYADNTASIAIQRVSKEERKNDMAKRSCRRTTDENAIHNKAVKIRKMTDEQLVHYVEDRREVKVLIVEKHRHPNIKLWILQELSRKLAL